MKRLFLLIGLLSVIAAFTIAESPFVFYTGEICDEGTDVFEFELDRSFQKGLLIRLNIFGSPDDTLADTTKIMLATRFSYPNQTGMQGLSAMQAWETYSDSFLTATTDTATKELWIPIDSLITGYDGTTLGNLIRLTFTSTDSLYTSAADAWCDSVGTSLKWQLSIGYF